MYLFNRAGDHPCSGATSVRGGDVADGDDPIGRTGEESAESAVASSVERALVAAEVHAGRALFEVEVHAGRPFDAEEMHAECAHDPAGRAVSVNAFSAIRRTPSGT